jgi:lauroyl/myristoyl acyltransferase
MDSTIRVPKRRHSSGVGVAAKPKIKTVLALPNIRIATPRERPLRPSCLTMIARCCVFWLFHGLRTMERLLPLPLLACMLWPAVATYALCRCLGKAGRSRARSFAAAYGSPSGFLGTFQAFIGETYGRLVSLWPDRFMMPRWRRRFTVTGLDPLLACRAEGRPVVLAIIHFHHMNVLRLFLRAHGLPVASLTFGPGVTTVRRSINSAVDHGTPLADTPHKFPLEQLRSAYAFLRSGNCLLIACDKPSDDTITLPTDLGTIGIHLGPFRLAAMTNAVVIPAIAWQQRPWRFHVAIGEPARPPAHSSDRSAFQPIAKHCLTTWQAVIRDYPEQLTPSHGAWNVPREYAQAD